MEISSKFGLTAAMTSYAIACPYEGGSASSVAPSNIPTAAAELNVSSWTWPYNYGDTAVVGTHLRYIWTNA
jgi:hypothetical protein